MRRLTAIPLTLLLLLVACTGEPPPERLGLGEREPARSTDGGAFVLPDDLQMAAALTPFAACDDYLAHVREQALEVVTPWGIGGWRGWDVGMAMEEEAAADAGGERASGDAATMAAPEPGVDYSGTNVQEAGVDEPDRVKTDGNVLYLVDDTRLRVLDITGEDPVELGSLQMRDSWDAQLLLDGDRLLVTSSTYGVLPFAGERIGDVLPHGGSVTTVTLVDVADPSTPRVLERLTVDGATVSARLVDGVARVVIRTEAGLNLPWVHPEGAGLRAERRALDANRQLVRESAAEDWIPYFVHETADGDSTERTLLACDQIARPDVFAGLGTLSVLTVDVADGGLLPDDGGVGVLAGGDTVYASAERLFVATTRWVDWESLSEREARREAERTVTEIHAFDITDPGGTRYLASGEVPGRLLNQWAMSEHAGHLRVATTVGDTSWWGGAGEPSQSLVSVLDVSDPGLPLVGQVDGLGPTERIYAVRFLGDVGYVVTFRETDPLYTIDLADPANPRATGELKITGYSAYLHPMGDDLLLGVGQDADERGMTLGMQLSLFDVSDPAAPQRLDQLTVTDGHSEVEWDHHAFLHWPATGLTVVPFQRWSWDEETHEEDSESGALAFTVSRDGGIAETGRLSHLAQLRRDFADAGGDPDLFGSTTADPDAALGGLHPGEWVWRGAINRTLVRGDRLLTISRAGVATHDLDTLQDLGWHRFGA
ncbi:beta-propeller domain-containing protein [Egicoccus sp. AB-alg2]|uniref:beta-propeller domain-containing protein n=1 Tax=Egicoccus sp. AB-alg2 TaxID=3242693 RepID=UPI00359F128C